MNEEVQPGDEIIVLSTCCGTIPRGTRAVVEALNAGSGRVYAKPIPGVVAEDECRRVSQWEVIPKSAVPFKEGDKVVVISPGKSWLPAGEWCVVAEVHGSRVKVTDEFRPEGEKNYWWFDGVQLQAAPTKKIAKYGYVIATQDYGPVRRGDILRLLEDRGGYCIVRLVSGLAPGREFAGRGAPDYLNYDLNPDQFRFIPEDYRVFTKGLRANLHAAKKDLETAKKYLNIIADERAWTDALREMVECITLHAPFIVQRRTIKVVNVRLQIRDFFDENPEAGDIKTAVFEELKQVVHESERLGDLRTSTMEIVND